MAIRNAGEVLPEDGVSSFNRGCRRDVRQDRKKEVDVPRQGPLDSKRPQRRRENAAQPKSFSAEARHPPPKADPKNLILIEFTQLEFQVRPPAVQGLLLVVANPRDVAAINNHQKLQFQPREPKYLRCSRPVRTSCCGQLRSHERGA
jgi:hypothetical protein